MIIYIKLGKVRGLTLELNTRLGLKPFYRKNSFRHETILDIPYSQVIYTSGRWRKNNRVILRSISNVHEKTKKAAGCSK